jgi:hypothetical protein
MQITRSRALATAGLIAIGAVVVADVGATPPPASAAVHDATLTARVTKIQHAQGRVTLTGTAAPGDHVFVGGDVREPATVTPDPSGTWRVVVGVGLGAHVVRVASDSDWTPIDVSVELVLPAAPSWTESVDDYGRRISLHGSPAHPGATMVISLDGAESTRVKVAANGAWSVVLDGLSFGEHDVLIEQRYDGAVNGASRLEYFLDGAPTVTTSEAVVDTGVIALAGTAPWGTRVAVRNEDGSPIVVAETFRGEWSTTIPMPNPGVRLYGLSLVTLDDDTDAGSTQASVVVPIGLTAVPTLVEGNRVRLTGAGEPGATVSFARRSGEPLRDSDGVPITTTIGNDGWVRTLDLRGLAGATLHLDARVGDRLVGRTDVVLPDPDTR